MRKRNKILPIIMAGGSGSRLWPMSRTFFPKQFLSLVSKYTMLQETIFRLDDIDHLSPLVICNQEHRFLVAEQLRTASISPEAIILEPFGRNTAPAVAIAALKAIEQGEDPILFVLSSDHVIKQTDAFTEAVKTAAMSAAQGYMTTFGVVPDKPETGFGYIKHGEQIAGQSYKVEAFVEKPDLSTAEEYLALGQYYWNSGMFMFNASTFLSELDKFSPNILTACKRSLDNAREDLDFVRLDEKEFELCPDDSIDYAVMEKTNLAVVVPMQAGWSDVGSWSALWDIEEKNSEGNVVIGDVIADTTKNSYINAQNRLVATVGVNDLIVVETKDAVLVAHRDHVQRVKNIVNTLKNDQRTEHLQHCEIFRPWGYHEKIADGERYHVKHIVVKPGGRTATQIHYHRAEHWVVVSGTAKVRNGEREYLVAENESTYIPVGSAHSFENPGKIPLELIEVRTGGYLEEDDIVRIDSYGEGY
ncbi:mannose-1-phosphate guanylyltransferase/mannose-6-phosphate isomerase [Enterovibrio norvegicus]|uniref:mannose-1-phosphate guanylyltransferase/mannose-6-phosphate isomerase n=1 Tax=Enterovibrio norvegicus TaxID=188144 RepID=UPI000555C0B3|nr:mannose-1-phosphate guanylyltransferase/mannose-6-phosphate isomerase [Enterovibrio norvegicus]OEF59638.1 mannose-1-phosphate guanylyltransferase/mannose-6-phosphate isomerase [Enterovibrio norvegicus]